MNKKKNLQLKQLSYFFICWIFYFLKGIFMSTCTLRWNEGKYQKGLDTLSFNVNFMWIFQQFLIKISLLARQLNPRCMFQPDVKLKTVVTKDFLFMKHGYGICKYKTHKNFPFSYLLWNFLQFIERERFFKTTKNLSHQLKASIDSPWKSCKASINSHNNTFRVSRGKIFHINKHMPNVNSFLLLTS